MSNFIEKQVFSDHHLLFLFSWCRLLLECLQRRQSASDSQKHIQEILKLGLTFPSCCSVRENASMNAWAITDRQPSMCGVFLMSKTNWGFFRMFTQKRRGRLFRERERDLFSSTAFHVRQMLCLSQFVNECFCPCYWSMQVCLAKYTKQQMAASLRTRKG